jgi:hypothetical protein
MSDKVVLSRDAPVVDACAAWDASQLADTPAFKAEERNLRRFILALTFPRLGLIDLGD